MNDTTPEIEARFYQMIMKRSGQERLMMGFSMFNLVRQQVVTAIRENRPDADMQDLRKEIFLRFYGHEYSAKEKGKILKQVLNPKKKH